MIYKFTLDDEEYEAELNVIPGIAATLETPPEGPEIEVKSISLIRGNVTIYMSPSFSPRYEAVENHLMTLDDDIYKQAQDEYVEGQFEDAEARADARREDF